MSANPREVISEDTMLKLAHNPGWTIPHLAFCSCKEHNQSTMALETIYYIILSITFHYLSIQLNASQQEGEYR